MIGSRTESSPGSIDSDTRFTPGSNGSPGNSVLLGETGEARSSDPVVAPPESYSATPKLEILDDHLSPIQSLPRNLDSSGRSIKAVGSMDYFAKSQPTLPDPENDDEVAPERAHLDDLLFHRQIRGLLPRLIGRPSSAQEPVTYHRELAAVDTLQRSIPPFISANAQMRESYMSFILGEYECARMSHYFRLPPPPLRSAMVSRMKRSRLMLSFMYLGARIFQAIANKGQSVGYDLCDLWIDRVDLMVSSGLPSNPSETEVEDQLTGLLEMAFLKIVVVNTVSGYLVLQRALPIFFKIVSADADLWTECQGTLRVSVPRALTTPRYEVRRFVFYDTMIALVLGVAPLGEYDSAGFPIVPEIAQPVEWVHGIPVELLVNIAQVHTWRTSGRGEDWAILELRTLAWKSPLGASEDGGSADAIARTAIQESWRHATLIYIYMGMCGVDSQDPRVQSSMQQIVHLMSLVSQISIDVHFSVPCLVAGIAARTEKQRSFVLEKLSSFRDTHVWILRGNEFCRVLCDLWLGAGVNGSPVLWNDYVDSRCRVLPIP